MEGEEPPKRWRLTTNGAFGGLLAGAVVGAVYGTDTALPLLWALFGGAIGFVLDVGSMSRNLVWPVLVTIVLSFGGFIGWAVICLILWAVTDCSRPDDYERLDTICHVGGYVFGVGIISAFLWAVVENLKRRRARMPLWAYLPGLLTCSPLLVLSCCLMVRALAAPHVPQRYPSFGKDTVDSFGDGRFQVLRSPDGKPGLCDYEQSDELLAVAYDWRETGDWIYAFGKDGEQVLHKDKYSGPSLKRVYLVVNWRSGRWTKYGRLEDVPPKHREQLGELKTQ
jgi:hypothetical protein